LSYSDEILVFAVGIIILHKPALTL